VKGDDRMNCARLLLLAALLGPFSGCGAEPPKLYCGAGIRPPVAELAAEFSLQHGTTIQCDYAGSEVLLSRIKLTRHGDLYMPGDVHYVEQAEKEGLVASSKTVCYFVPVILVAKDNPEEILTLADLGRPGIRVGLGDPEACAIGRLCSRIFEKNGIDEEGIDVKYRSPTVNDLGNHIKLGSLDAAIVWDAVAACFAESSDVVPIPVQENIISTVAVGVLKSSPHPELAGKFVDFITSPRGKEIFAKHHYTTQPPE